MTAEKSANQNTAAVSAKQDPKQSKTEIMRLRVQRGEDINAPKQSLVERLEDAARGYDEFIDETIAPLFREAAAYIRDLEGALGVFVVPTAAFLMDEPSQKYITPEILSEWQRGLARARELLPATTEEGGE